MLPSRHVESSWETKSAHLKLVVIVLAPAMYEVYIHIHLPCIVPCTVQKIQVRARELDTFQY